MLNHIASIEITVQVYLSMSMRKMVKKLAQFQEEVRLPAGGSDC